MTLSETGEPASTYINANFIQVSSVQTTSELCKVCGLD